MEIISFFSLLTFSSIICFQKDVINHALAETNGNSKDDEDISTVEWMFDTMMSSQNANVLEKSEFVEVFSRNLKDHMICDWYDPQRNSDNIQEALLLTNSKENLSKICENGINYRGVSYTYLSSDYTNDGEDVELDVLHKFIAKTNDPNSTEKSLLFVFYSQYDVLIVVKAPKTKMPSIWNFIKFTVIDSVEEIEE